MNLQSTFCVLATACALILLTGCQPSNDSTSAKATQQPAPASLSFFALDVGKEVNADHSVAPLTLFAPADKIIASVRTKGAAKAVPVTAKLIAMSNGQALSELSQTVTTTGPATTHFEFGKTGPWASGRYLVEVTIGGKPEGRQEIEVRESVPPQPSAAPQKQD